MAGMRMRKLALCGALVTVQSEFTAENMPDKRTLLKMAVKHYRESLNSGHPNHLG